MTSVDVYYTERFDKYPGEKNVYHVLYACPSGVQIKFKHREYKFPPPEQKRQPCQRCLKEWEVWLRSVPEAERPTWFQ